MDTIDRNTEIANQIPEYGTPFKIGMEFYVKLKSCELYVFRITDNQFGQNTPCWAFCGLYVDKDIK